MLWSPSAQVVVRGPSSNSRLVDALSTSMIALSRVVRRSVSQGCGAYGEGEHKRAGTCNPHITKVQPESRCGPPPNEMLRAVAPETTERPMAELVRAIHVLRTPAKVSSDPGPAVTVGWSGSEQWWV